MEKEARLPYSSDFAAFDRSLSEGEESTEIMPTDLKSLFIISGFVTFWDYFGRFSVQKNPKIDRN